MDPSLITKIAAAGAMGVSIFCIIKVYGLLKTEQKKDISQQGFKTPIYIFMGFGVLMTGLSLAIEVIRNNMEIEKEKGLFVKLSEMSNQGYYSVDENGNPKTIEIQYAEDTIILSKAFPKDTFKRSELKLVRQEKENNYLAVKRAHNSETIFGFISNTDVENFWDKASMSKGKLEARELLSLGTFFAPLSAAKEIDYPKVEDSYLSTKNLIELIQDESHTDMVMKKKAIKLLIQPDLMKTLNDTQYKILIKALSSRELRPAPYYLYELAQVYMSRAKYGNQSDVKADKEKHLEYLSEYINYCKKDPQYLDEETHPIEKTWYDDAIKDIGIAVL